MNKYRIMIIKNHIAKCLNYKNYNLIDADAMVRVLRQNGTRAYYCKIK